MTLELLDGRIIAPLNVFDVLDAVEEYMGTDVRQFLEEYFTDGDPWESLPDDEKTKRLQEHHEDVMDAVEDLVLRAEYLVKRKPIDRKRALEVLNAIKKLIYRKDEYEDR